MTKTNFNELPRRNPADLAFVAVCGLIAGGAGRLLLLRFVDLRCI